MPEYESQKKWKAEHTTVVTIRLNHNTDADILLRLSQVDSKQGYIKDLIRKDLRASHPSK